MSQWLIEFHYQYSIRLPLQATYPVSLPYCLTCINYKIVPSPAVTQTCLLRPLHFQIGLYIFRNSCFYKRGSPIQISEFLHKLKFVVAVWVSLAVYLCACGHLSISQRHVCTCVVQQWASSNGRYCQNTMVVTSKQTSRFPYALMWKLQAYYLVIRATLLPASEP